MLCWIFSQISPFQTFRSPRFRIYDQVAKVIRIRGMRAFHIVIDLLALYLQNFTLFSFESLRPSTSFAPKAMSFGFNKAGAIKNVTNVCLGYSKQRSHINTLSDVQSNMDPNISVHDSTRYLLLLAVIFRNLCAVARRKYCGRNSHICISTRNH